MRGDLAGDLFDGFAVGEIGAEVLCGDGLGFGVGAGEGVALGIDDSELDLGEFEAGGVVERFLVFALREAGEGGGDVDAVARASARGEGEEVVVAAAEGVGGFLGLGKLNEVGGFAVGEGGGGVVVFGFVLEFGAGGDHEGER